MRRDLRHTPRGHACALAVVLALGTWAGLAHAEEGDLQRRRAPIAYPTEPRSGLGTQVPNPSGDIVPIGDPRVPPGPRVPPDYTPFAGGTDSAGFWQRLGARFMRAGAARG